MRGEGSGEARLELGDGVFGDVGHAGRGGEKGRVGGEKGRVGGATTGAGGERGLCRLVCTRP